jgi:hypothetical protein
VPSCRRAQRLYQPTQENNSCVSLDQLGRWVVFVRDIITILSTPSSSLSSIATLGHHLVPLVLLLRPVLFSQPRMVVPILIGYTVQVPHKDHSFSLLPRLFHCATMQVRQRTLSQIQHDSLRRERTLI